MSGRPWNGLRLLVVGQRLAETSLLRFATVGLFTTALDVALFALLTGFFGVAVIPANLISYSTGVVTSFALNRAWTFGLKGATTQTARQAVRFALSNIAGLAASSVLVGLFAKIMPPPLAKIISVPIIFVWNYSLARFWVFR